MRLYHLTARKINRDAFAAEIKAMADRLGVTCQYGVFDPQYPGEVRLEIGLGHFRVSTDIGADLNLNAFVADWYTRVASLNDLGRVPDFPENFGRVISRRHTAQNEITRGKATTVEATFEGFLLSLERGIACLKPILAEANIPMAVQLDPIAA